MHSVIRSATSQKISVLWQRSGVTLLQPTKRRCNKEKSNSVRKYNTVNLVPRVSVLPVRWREIPGTRLYYILRQCQIHIMRQWVSQSWKHLKQLGKRKPENFQTWTGFEPTIPFKTTAIFIMSFMRSSHVRYPCFSSFINYSLKDTSLLSYHKAFWVIYEDDNRQGLQKVVVSRVMRWLEQRVQFR